jgi:hypothetical protein
VTRRFPLLSAPTERLKSGAKGVEIGSRITNAPRFSPYRSHAHTPIRRHADAPPNADTPLELLELL